MVAYNAIPDTDVDAESPLTTTFFTELRDNPIAIAEGADGAPKVSPLAQLSFVNAFWGNVGDGVDGPAAYSAATALDPDIYSFTTFSLATGGSLSLSSKGALIIRCAESFTMADGTSIDLSGRGGVGGALIYGADGNPGEGQEVSPFANPLYFGGGGGGGGANGNIGGAGGDCYDTAGGLGGQSGSASGSDGVTTTLSELTKMLAFGRPLTYGGAGGGGGGDGGGGDPGWAGGTGGGLLIIIAPIITIGSGTSINVSGNNGQNGGKDDSAGGGGGGGSILLFSRDYTNNGLTVDVTGGDRGTSSSGSGGHGGNGGDGLFTRTAL